MASRTLSLIWLRIPRRTLTQAAERSKCRAISVTLRWYLALSSSTSAACSRVLSACVLLWRSSVSIPPASSAPSEITGALCIPSFWLQRSRLKPSNSNSVSPLITPCNGSRMPTELIEDNNSRSWRSFGSRRLSQRRSIRCISISCTPLSPYQVLYHPARIFLRRCCLSFFLPLLYQLSGFLQRDPAAFYHAHHLTDMLQHRFIWNLRGLVFPRRRLVSLPVSSLIQFPLLHCSPLCTPICLATAIALLSLPCLPAPERTAQIFSPPVSRVGKKKILQWQQRASHLTLGELSRSTCRRA